MSKLLGLLAAMAVVASPVLAQTTKSADPLVQQRSDMSAANKASEAELAGPKQEREQAKAKAKAEMVAEKKENKAKAKAEAAKAAGKDPLVVQRELDAKSNAAYKQKAKAANSKYAEAKKASKAKADASKAEAKAKAQKATASNATAPKVSN